MDNLIEFLITIAFVVLFSLPGLLKKKKETQSKRPIFTTGPVFEEEDMEEYKSEDFLQESPPEIPKQEEYFTYETIEENSWKEPEMKEKKSAFDSQHSDNKREEGGLLSFEEDEVLKGVIYSEILKRKF